MMYLLLGVIVLIVARSSTQPSHVLDIHEALCVVLYLVVQVLLRPLPVHVVIPGWDMVGLNHDDWRE